MSWGLARAVVTREVRLSARRPVAALLPVVFFVVASSLFPLGIGPEPATLRQIAPGIVWVCALLATMLSLGRLYAEDKADGSLEQMLLAPGSALWLVGAKAAAHWLVSGWPLILVVPLLALAFDMDSDAVMALAATLLLGTPVLSLVGGLGAALTLSSRNPTVLLLLLVLPLCIPVLVFGAGAVEAVAMGMSAQGHFSLLAALLLLALLGAPLATAAALNITV